MEQKAVLEAIVKNREKQGPFKDLADFCERMQNDSVNKKCIEEYTKLSHLKILNENIINKFYIENIDF